MKIRKIKAGLSDSVTMFKDKNFRPFARPFLVLLFAAIIIVSLHKGTSSQIAEMKKKAEAQAVELENREEYLRNRSKYVKLIEELPSNEQKDVWHRTQIVTIREQASLDERALVNGNETKVVDGVFTISTVPITAELTYEQLGKVVEIIENYPSFLRISDLKVARKPGELEKLSVTFNTNTIFVQDKDFPNLKGGKK